MWCMEAGDLPGEAIDTLGLGWKEVTFLRRVRAEKGAYIVVDFFQNVLFGHEFLKHHTAGNDECFHNGGGFNIGGVELL